MLDHVFVITYPGNEVSVTPVPALNMSCDPRYRPEMHHNPNFGMNSWAINPTPQIIATAAVPHQALAKTRIVLVGQRGLSRASSPGDAPENPWL